MDPQKLRVSGTYLSVMITKDVWDHVLVPCLTFKYVYRFDRENYCGFKLFSTWIQGGIVMPLQPVLTCNEEIRAIRNKILDYI